MGRGDSTLKLKGEVRVGERKVLDGAIMRNNPWGLCQEEAPGVWKPLSCLGVNEGMPPNTHTHPSEWHTESDDSRKLYLVNCDWVQMRRYFVRTGGRE